MSKASFTQAQILISQFGSIHNERIRKYFRNRPSDQTEIAQQRQFLGTLLTINPERDNMLSCLFKFLFFYMLAGAAFEGLAQVYGTPVRQYQAATNFQPQILIRFREREINKADLPLRTYRLEKEISFHLSKERTPKNRAELKSLANRCKQLFFPAGRAFNYNSGLVTFRYKDEEGLYRLAIDVTSRAIALQLIDKCLDVQNVKFDAGNLSQTEFTKSKPQKITVLNQRVDKPIRGRSGKVYCFQIEYHQKGIAPRVLVNPNGVIPF
jgi:hypothetical protein